MSAQGLPSWFDSHCHLQDQYRADATGAGEYLTRAQRANVVGLVCVGTDVQTSRQALSLASWAHDATVGTNKKMPKVFATVGLHPHHANQGADELCALLDQITQNQGVKGSSYLVGIGECGLDYHYEHSPKATQREVFATQVRLAHEYGLALVIHARDAWEDLFAILETEGTPPRTILHCFTGGPKEATRSLALGAMISLSGIVTFRNAQEVREAALVTPPSRLLIETDSPFLAPIPHRGKTNEPSFVGLVGTFVAELKGMEEAEFAAQSLANACSVFNITTTFYNH